MVDEIAAALQLADQYCYSNTFIYTQPGNGKVKIKLTGTKDLLLLKQGDEFEVDTSTRRCRILPGIMAVPLVVSCRCFWKCRKLLPRRAWCRCMGQMS